MQKTRLAKCGHTVPIHPGRQRRACEACASHRPTSRSCRACGASFAIPARPGAVPVYCTSRCRDWWARHPGTRTPTARYCRWCGNQLKSANPRHLYCSTRCGNIGRGVIPYGPRLQLECVNPECGKPFLKVYYRQRCCSERCGKRRWDLQAKAEGRTYHGPWDDRRRDNYHRRRALKKSTSTGAPVIRDEIGERDRWKCGICGKRVRRGLAYPDPMSPSLDHVIPLSRGGAHSPENVRIAHLACNVSKGDRGGGEQLMLVG